MPNPAKRLLTAGAAATALAAAACGARIEAPPISAAPDVAPVARMLFGDEFNGSKLDKAIWFWCYPSGSPDYCTNGQQGLPYREREQYRPSQLVVRDGSLHVIAVRRSVKPHFPWTSGMVTTGGPFENGPPQPTFAFRYGYAEIPLSCRRATASGRRFGSYRRMARGRPRST